MVRFIHVPKTGGVTLREAITGHLLCDGHLTTVSTAQEADIITIVRDPLTRYASAFWWLAARTLWPWPSPDAMACQMGTKLVDNAFKRYMVLWRQTHWLDAKTPLLWVGHTETLNEDAGRLGVLMGLSLVMPRRNVGRYRPTPLSAQGEANLREFYAADYELLQEVDRWEKIA